MLSPPCLLPVHPGPPLANCAIPTCCSQLAPCGVPHSHSSCGCRRPGKPNALCAAALSWPRWLSRGWLVTIRCYCGAECEVHWCLHHVARPAANYVDASLMWPAIRPCSYCPTGPAARLQLPWLVGGAAHAMCLHVHRTVAALSSSGRQSAVQTRQASGARPALGCAPLLRPDPSASPPSHLSQARRRAAAEPAVRGIHLHQLPAG